MDEQLEMIEEIEELSVEEPTKEVATQVEPPKEETKQEEIKVEEVKKEVVEPQDTVEKKEENIEVIQKSNKGKNILTIILAILLFIDLAALIIYLIGIEKVLSFVK